MVNSDRPITAWVADRGTSAYRETRRDS